MAKRFSELGVTVDDGRKIFNCQQVSITDILNSEIEVLDFLPDVKTITANYQTLTTADAFVVVKYSRKTTSDYCILYMPSNPNNGQIVTIKNLDDVGYNDVHLHGNGHKICPGDDVFKGDNYDPYNGGTYMYIKAGRAQQYIFDGSKWQQVGQYEW